MGFWFLLLMWAATFVVGDLIRPKPEFENAKPAGLGDFNFPTATEGRVVPIIWGQLKIAGPNVLWYGDFDKWAVTENVSTGFFSSEDITLGYEYFIGMQFGICRGPGVQLFAIFIGGKRVKYAYSGQTDGFSPYNAIYTRVLADEDDDSGHFLLRSSKLVGYSYFYDGALDQAVNSYLDSKLSDVPAYRGTAYVVFHQWASGHYSDPGSIGQTTSIAPWAFEVRRVPDGLGLASSNPGAEFPNTNAVDCGDANPMNVIYEILTDTDWGLGVPVAQIDTNNFREAAGTLFDEVHGFSITLDSPREATELLDEVSRQIDGVLFFNREASMWQMTLIRDDYDTSLLDIYDEDNIMDLTNFARTTWQETTNQVNVKFNERVNDYKETYAMAQDTANMQMQGATVSVDISFPGVKYGSLATVLAWRELATLSYPLSKIAFTVNRKAFDLAPGSVFKLSWARLGITEIVYRVSRIDYGNIEKGTIEIHAIQDIFAAGTGILADPPGTGWEQVDSTPDVGVLADMLTFEAPGQMVTADTYNPTLNPRVWMGGRDPGGITISFKSYLKIGPSRPILTDYQEDSRISVFLLRGTLETAVPDYAATIARPVISELIRIDDLAPDDLSELENIGNATSISSMRNIIYVGGEFIGYEALSAPVSDVVQLTTIYRGLFNSVPRNHDVGAEVWFIGQSGGNLTQVALPTNYDEMDIQLRSSSGGVETEEGETPVIEVTTLTEGWKRPLPPRDPMLNGSFASDYVSFDVDYSTETGFTGDDGRGCSLNVTPRSWRVNPILQDHILSYSSPPYMDDDPEFDYVIILDPEGTADPTEVVNVSGTDDPLGYVTRNNVIIALGANVSIPDTATLRVTAKHTVNSNLLSADQDMEFSFIPTSALQVADDMIFGGLTVDISSDAVIAGEAGSYTFDIHTALPSSGIVEVNLNGAGWNTLIPASSSSGAVTLAVSDSVVIRFTELPTEDQFFDVAGPTELGYGVLRS